MTVLSELTTAWPTDVMTRTDVTTDLLTAVTDHRSATVSTRAADGPARIERQGGAPMEADLPELSFVHPLPGFPGMRRFVLVQLDDAPPADHADHAEGDESAEGDEGDEAGPGEELPVLYELRSVERPELRFLVGVPAAFFPEYTIELDDKACEDLALTSADDALVLVILSSGGDATSTTANLLAPVVINAQTRAAAQIILTGSDWPVRAAVA